VQAQLKHKSYYVGITPQRGNDSVPQTKSKALPALSGMQGFGNNTILISVLVSGLQSIKWMWLFV